MRFKDKVVLVTGGSRGIGRATAINFAKEGARVVVNYISNKEAADSAVNEIQKAGSEAIAIKCDVSKKPEVKQMVGEALRHFGKIDILVNNAGIVFDVPFRKRTLEQWQRTLDVNLTGIFLMCKELEPHIKSGGSIINIASTNGIDGYSPGSIDYDVTKAGVIIFSKALSIELAPRVRVNTVAPGWIDTDINKDLPADYVKSETRKIKLGSFGKPEDIAKAVLFLASDDASYITGTTLVVDGGYGGWD
jgi:3-oxoacyl-[acyl-carrier protein] reductase